MENGHRPIIALPSGVADTALSVQLFSVREELEADLDGTLARLRDLGFARVEPFAFAQHVDALAAALDRAGLSAPSGHEAFLWETASFGDRTIQVPPRPVVFAAAQRLGLRYVIQPAAPDWSSKEAVDEIASRLTDSAREAADFGLTVGYHNHWWEIESRIDGRLALEYLADATPDDVVFEVDIYWATVGGADVPALLQRLGDRARALHVKDGPVIAAPSFDTDPRTYGQLPAGRGEVDVEGCLRAAPAVELAVVEFDAFDGDVVTAIGESAEYLRARELV
jgi:sugar phosphate isomerase/epimerase